MPAIRVTWIDISILVTYLLGTRILFGWYYGRKTRIGGAESYFLGGRELRWPLLGLSFYVSNMSGSTFVGLPGAGYSSGIAVFHYEWLPALIMIFFVIFLLPLFLKGQIFTSPAFLELRYGAESRLVFSGFLLLTNIFIDAAAALYSGGMVFRALFPDIELWWVIAVTAALAGFYIFFGGLAAAVMNDGLQAVMIMLGGTAVAFLSWQAVPSWAAVVENAPPGGLSLIQPASDPNLPWPGIFTGVLIIGIYFWCTNQFMIQRALGAKSLSHARYGALFAGILKLPNLFLLILPGVMARTLYPNLSNPDLVFPTLAFGLLPIGLRGLMLAALAAAILSSLESILNSASTLFTMDFVQKVQPPPSDRMLVRCGRITTLLFMVIAALWAPQIQRFPTLWQYLQSVLAYVTPPIVAVFLMGVFWPRSSRGGAVWTMLTGLLLGAGGWMLIEVRGVIQLQFLYACGLLFLINCALMMVFSLMTAPPAPEVVEQYTWRPELWRRETTELAQVPWYLNYRVQSWAVVVVTAAVLVWWI